MKSVLNLDNELRLISFALKSDIRRKIIWLLRQEKRLTLTDLTIALGYGKCKKALIYYHIKVLEEAGLISSVKLEGNTGRRKYYVLTPLCDMLISSLSKRRLITSDDPIYKVLHGILGDDRLKRLYIRASMFSVIFYLAILTLSMIRLMFKGIAYLTISPMMFLVILYAMFIPPLIILGFLGIYVRINRFMIRRKLRSIYE